MKTHWKKLNNPDFLGAYAINPGEDLIATIDYAREETFIGTGGKKDEGLVVHFAEKDIKPMICNATNSKTITKVAGSPYVEDWHGVKIAFYSAEVSAFGETVDALRIRPYPPKMDEYFCVDCKKKIEGYGKLTAKQVADATRSKYGRYLCTECGTVEREKLEAKEKEGDVLNENN